MRSHMKFGQILVQAGVLSETDLDSALSTQRDNGMALGRILEEKGLIDDRDIVAVLARQFDLPCIDSIDDIPGVETAQGLIDCDLALKMGVFPLRFGKTTAEIAVSNPLDFNTLDRLAFKTGRHIRPVLATPTVILKAIQRFYLQEPTAEVSSGIHLLIIDNHDLYRSTICSNLKQNGYLPLFAGSVEEAIHIAQKCPPRLTLVDTCMKMVNSQMILEQLRQSNGIGEGPIIALTANHTAEEEAFLLRLGYFDVIAKPLNYTRLQARIERTLNFYYQGAAAPFAAPSGRPEISAFAG